MEGVFDLYAVVWARGLGEALEVFVDPPVILLRDGVKLLRDGSGKLDFVGHYFLRRRW